MCSADLTVQCLPQEKLQSLLESTRLEASAWRRRADTSDASLKETVDELQQNNLVLCELTEQVSALRYGGGVAVGVGWGWEYSCRCAALAAMSTFLVTYSGTSL